VAGLAGALFPGHDSCDRRHVRKLASSFRPATNDGVDVCVDLESFVGVSVSVDLVENAFDFFLAADLSASSASMAANFIMASRNGFSFSMAGEGGEGLGEHRLLIPLDDSTIMDCTNRLLVASARLCASELFPFLRTTWWSQYYETFLFCTNEG